MPTPPRVRRRLPRRAIALAVLLALAAVLVLAGCSGRGRMPSQPGTPSPPRTFAMGFCAIPPRLDFDLLVATLEMWSQRADAAIIHIEPPWDSLLAGVAADSIVIRNLLGLVNYYDSKGFELVLTLDATNGLDRSAESATLVNAGRSITEPSIQALYREFAVALDTLLHPRRLGLGAETNLIRAVAPAPLYAAVVRMTNDAATAVRQVDPAVQLYMSVQVEVAWGRLTGSGPFVGIDQDLADFPFAEAIGLSSYPYLGGFAEPEDVPLDYYERVLRGQTRPGLVVEGGWTSATVGGAVSTPAKQARWIRHQAAMLDSARAEGVFQLTFTDLDPSLFPPGSILPLFASLGLVDVNLVPKPALAPWDSTFARPRAAAAVVTRRAAPIARSFVPRGR